MSTTTTTTMTTGATTTGATAYTGLTTTAAEGGRPDRMIRREDKNGVVFAFGDAFSREAAKMAILMIWDQYAVRFVPTTIRTGKM